jgi:hypothetical protein
MSSRSTSITRESASARTRRSACAAFAERVGAHSERADRVRETLRAADDVAVLPTETASDRVDPPARSVST